MGSKIVKSAGRLLQLFGEWPSFHDAEVLEITLRRSGRSLNAKFFIFQTTDEVDVRGYFRRVNKCELTLRFEEIQDLVLENFNHQNVISTLSITQGPPIKVVFEPLFGVVCSFTCARIELAELTPLKDSEPDGDPVGNTNT